jgi:hypothetical protein
MQLRKFTVTAALGIVLAACGGSGSGSSSSAATTPTGSTGSGGTTTPTPVGAAPTSVTATSWPYTALVSFTPPAANGRTVASYTVTAVNAKWITGTAPASPVMAYGGGKGWSGAKYNFQVVANYTDGTVSPTSDPSPVAVGTSGGGPSPLVYSGGVFYWEGDYSYQGTAAYADTTGDPGSNPAGGGPYDVMLTSTAQGAWQPWSPGGIFDLTPYHYMEFDLKPTIAGESWSMYFEAAGDIAVGVIVGIPSDTKGTYGPAPVAGQWAHYKVPLVNLNVGPGTPNPIIYKFGIKDHLTGTHVFYIDNVKFS